MLSATYKPFMLSVVMLSVIKMSVVEPTNFRQSETYEPKTHLLT